MSILDTLANEVADATLKLEATANAAIINLLEAQKLNETMQKKHVEGSPDWHMHETIDDKIHDALSKLGH
jgi:hypothetical protein